MTVKCQKCDHPFKDNYALKKHLDGKRKCDQGDFKCDKCPKRFNHASNRSRHQKTCQGPVQSAKEEMNALKDQVADLQRTIEQINRVQHTTINNDNSVHYNIQVNVVGNESKRIIETMTPEELVAAIKFLPSDETYWNYAQILRCNPASPQNHNVAAPSADGDVHLRYTKKDRNNVFSEKWARFSSDEGMTALLMQDTEDLKDLCERVKEIYDTSSFESYNDDIRKKVYNLDFAQIKRLLKFLQQHYADEFPKLQNVSREAIL